MFKVINQQVFPGIFANRSYLPINVLHPIILSNIYPFRITATGTKFVRITIKFNHFLKFSWDFTKNRHHLRKIAGSNIIHCPKFLTAVLFLRLGCLHSQCDWSFSQTNHWFLARNVRVPNQNYTCLNARKTFRI